MNNIKIFEDNMSRNDICSDSNPKIFNIYNPGLNRKFIIYPYLKNGLLDMDNPWRKDIDITGNLFKFKHEIFSNNDDILAEIFDPSLYDYNYNIIRQIVLDYDTKEIIAETGARRIFRGTEFTNVIKLNHRFYMARKFRSEFVGSKKMVNWLNQSFVKQQYLMARDMNYDIMYEIRKKSNSLWKINFRKDSEFFNENQGWFYTERPVDIMGFVGYPLIWYDKTKYTKETALEHLQSL
jgi:hypothetical protein